VELRPADIDAHHVRRAGLQHAIGEATRRMRRRRAHAHLADRARSVRARRELFAAAAHETWRLLDAELDVREIPCGFVESLGAAQHAPAHDQLSVEQPPRFVSRGGEKLAGALERFALDLRGAHALDVGASTGGFTDCVLQAGAADVVCVDVGRAQLHAKLRGDPRVTNLEKINARHLTAADLPRAEFDAVVMDLSFISLRAVLPAVWPLLRVGGTLVALVKRNSKAGKAEADKGRGVIRDRAVQDQVLADVSAFALANLRGAKLVGTMDSPITGGDGNREFLLVLRKED